MLRFEETGDAVDRFIVDEDGAEKGLLRLEVVRRLPEDRRFRLKGANRGIAHRATLPQRAKAARCRVCEQRGYPGMPTRSGSGLHVASCRGLARDLGRRSFEQRRRGTLCRLRVFLRLGLGAAYVLAAGLLRRFIGRTRHIDSDMWLDLGVKLDAELVQPKRLDRPVQHHLAPLDGEAAFGDGFGDVAGRNRAVELAGVAGLADNDEALSVELGRHGLGVALELEVARFELGALALEALAIGFGSAQRLALGQ